MTNVLISKTILDYIMAKGSASNGTACIVLSFFLLLAIGALVYQYKTYHKERFTTIFNNRTSRGYGYGGPVFVPVGGGSTTVITGGGGGTVTTSSSSSSVGFILLFVFVFIFLLIIILMFSGVGYGYDEPQTQVIRINDGKDDVIVNNY